MSFTTLKLDESSVCNCMDGAVEDTVTTFTRRISVKGRVKAADFRAPIERDTPFEADTCEKFCGLREISINDVDNYQEASIVEEYKKAMMNNKIHIFSPQLKLNYCKIKFVNDSGYVKYTPHHGHESHFDFYKMDSFDINKIEVVDYVDTDFPNAQVQPRPTQ